MSHQITLVRPDEETLRVVVDGDELTTVTHDSVGWAGMAAVEKVAVGLAQKLGIPLVEAYDEEDDA